MENDDMPLWFKLLVITSGLITFVAVAVPLILWGM
jgi:hypothetical protein